MLGYTTKRKAIAQGCTHHGSYYGIPIWMGDVDSEAPVVFAKWTPLDLLILAASCIEGVCHLIRGTEPCFMFKLLGEIK